MSTVQRFRKKPVEIEATQWFRNGDHPDDGPVEREGAVVRYFRRPEPEYAGVKIHELCGSTWHEHGWIDTLEGGHTVCPGDWIITGVQGERYPCKPDIFEATYEPVESKATPGTSYRSGEGLSFPVSTPIVFLDTETTGLDPYDEIWEFGAIRREPDGTEEVVHAFINHSPELCARLPESFQRDHLTRFPGARGDACDGSGPGTLSKTAAAALYSSTLRGDPRPHVVGAVPNFDTERIARELRSIGEGPGWHYHLVDVENLAVGFLNCRLLELAAWMPTEVAEAERIRQAIALPWDSEALSLALGVLPAVEEERHTALGDARWAMRLYDAITGRSA